MTDGGSVGWRLSDLVHVLAQLPEGVRLDLSGNGDRLARARPLCGAYGLGDRVSLTEAAQEEAAWRFRDASPEAPAWAAHDSLDDLPRDDGRDGGVALARGRGPSRCPGG